eukprot:Awhi_evm1s10042
MTLAALRPPENLNSQSPTSVSLSNKLKGFLGNFIQKNTRTEKLPTSRTKEKKNNDPHSNQLRGYKTVEIKIAQPSTEPSTLSFALGHPSSCIDIDSEFVNQQPQEQQKIDNIEDSDDDEEEDFIILSIVDSSEKLARYKLLKEINVGSTSRVSLAKDVKTGSLVALKSIKKKIRSELSLEREIELLSSLRHPHIIALIDIIETETSLILVQEYMDGGDLIDRVPCHQGCKEITALLYLDQITSAISHMHDHDIVHRDIKPDNCVCDKEGFIKLIDFGAALPVAEHMTNKKETNSKKREQHRSPKTTYKEHMNKLVYNIPPA